MNVRTPASVFVGLAAVIIVATLVSATGAFPPGTKTTTTASGQTSAYFVAPDGLKLTLRISGVDIGMGGSIVVNATESNTNANPVNKSTANGWPLRGLRMSACYSSVYPFGVAVYQGHFTETNVSSAVPLMIFPFQPCPLLLRYISGYYFLASGDMAVVLPGSKSSSIPMTSGLVVSGNYTNGNNRISFAPGEYTVAAGDEWGSVVLLHFSVA